MVERGMHNYPLHAAAGLADAELLATVKRLASNERQSTVQLVAHLAEMDARRLYLGEGCSSLFTYCTQVLHLSDTASRPNRSGTGGAEVHPEAVATAPPSHAVISCATRRLNVR